MSTGPSPTIRSLSVAGLRAKIRAAAKAYFNGTKPLATDREYDALVDELDRRAPNDALLKAVGADPGRGAVKLPFPMMSLNKVRRGRGELASWVARRPDADEFTVSDKLDGTSAMVVWRPSGERAAFRRGTGDRGANVSHLVELVVPRVARTRCAALALADGAAVAVRGELVVRTTDRATRFANARSHANALATRSAPESAADAAEFAPLRFVAYELVSPRLEKRAQMSALKRLGFEVVFHRRAGRSHLTDDALGDAFASRRRSSPYDIDGLVVEAGGVHAVAARRNPEYAVAFKDPSAGERRVTTVRAVEWRESAKTGNLAPTVAFDPVVIDGVTIRRATGHNAKRVRDLGIGVGARVEVVRAGNVIPSIAAVVERAKRAAVPSVPYEWSASGVHAVAKGSDSARRRRRLA